ncbi:Hsp20/alpha crystallin family protein [Ovoidimarina sediminis]|uniref:Hsp20/alpha crystallin family protein n=1 Tax=Ovoidimarina sediminis TaxID=3079856 RepID=UPI00290AD11C|nr:Hsp20/alpha crystallin family protein [Rhodophyticola sp. MJ-SS7]MDU8945176.1 Hsp20/alpha crystallin family protein [Rhodophyticola sp. MJ-SS7]
MVEKSHTSGFWPSLYDPLRHMGARLAEWIAPAAEASGNDKHYTISVELPGVAEEDIDLSVEDGVVTLKGEKKTEREESGDTWFFCERQYGSFSRSFRLPPDADPKGVSAELKDGVLTVSIAKRSQQAPETAKVKIARG